MKVLLIEDSGTEKQVVRNILRLRGHSLDILSDLPEDENLFNDYDLVLRDIIVQAFDGSPEAVEAINEQVRTFPNLHVYSGVPRVKVEEWLKDLTRYIPKQAGNFALIRFLEDYEEKISGRNRDEDKESTDTENK